MKSNGRKLHGVGARRPSRIAIAFLQCVAIALALPVVQATPAGAEEIASASFNVAYAKQGTQVTLTVTTDNSTECVQVSGPGNHDGEQTEPSGQDRTVWTFNFTAGTGNGTQTYNITSKQGSLLGSQCGGLVNPSDTATASYVLDNAGPTITGSRTPPANANGWNNTDVGVNFACTDTGSGVQSCSPSTTTIFTTEGANQSLAGTGVDNLGNTSTTTVNVNIDETKPTLTGTPTTAPIADGWYAGNVSIDWICADQLSGIQSCPANSTITGEGAALTASASVNDRAGNTTSAQSSPVKIDRTDPVTTAEAQDGWTNATVTLTPTDALSGVSKTEYRLDPNIFTSWKTGASVSVSGSGTHTLEWRSTDKVGNVESTKSATFRIDLVAPTISHTQNPAANTNGWNNANVTVTFTCNDAGPTGQVSGIASCTAPVTFSDDGAGQQVTGQAIDRAENVANDPVTVNVDKTKPTISAARDRAANGDGWYNADVDVSFTCGDALSGVASCSPSKHLGEGADQSASGTVTDAAGNTASVTESDIDIDKTAPSITGAPTTSPGATGWYKGDVTIHWTCSDALSGVVVCPQDTVITTSGDAVTVTESVTDRAGNTTVATSPAVKIDRHAPVTTSDAPEDWQRNDVTVVFSPTDPVSGTKTTYFTVDGGAPQTGTSVTITKENRTEITFWSEDKAGNVEETRTVQVFIDKGVPTIGHSQSPAANGKGWNNSDVTVTFTCADTVSGIESCTPEQKVVNSEGANQTVSGTAIDGAGNEASDSASVSIDKSAPTVAAAADRAPNAHGWYKDAVTVGFICNDAVSGVDTCPAEQVFIEGKNQKASGTASDNAGIEASTSLDGINVDSTPPTISGGPTTAANNGWHRDDVVIDWSCADELSGLDGDCPANSTITGEGDAFSASATIADKAGNESVGAVGGVKIDRTAPSTTAEAPTGWVNDGVTVALTPNDNLSGVETTHYILDDGDEKTGESVGITEEGEHTLEYWSVDTAGNEEEHLEITISIDKSAPTITSGQAPAANGRGWNNTDVTVTFTCDDQAELSDIASCTAPKTVTAEGRHQEVAGRAEDHAGNEASATARVSIDKTQPTITGAADGSPNAHGWYNRDVFVPFSCEDTLAGIASCTETKMLAEGANQSVTGTAVDAADNAADVTVSGINVDKTPPTISGAVTTQPNDAGWYRGNVVVHWTCEDPLSGIAGACPADTVIDGEGDNLSATASVNDLAGNVATATVPGIKIDRTTPSTTADAPAAWQKTDVVVGLDPSDSLSQVAATRYVLDGDEVQDGTTVAITGEGIHTLEFWSVDLAGNEEEHHTATIRIDQTVPGIARAQTPRANGNGWNNTPVTVSFACTDELSLIATCSDETTLSDDGEGQTVTGTASDNAGNTATNLATVNIDQAEPTISAARDRVPNGNGWYDDDVTVSFSCTDALSGVASCAGPQQVGQGEDQSVTGTVSDFAGNTAEVTEGNIDVDKTDPSISGAPTSEPNSNGWYRENVTVAWTCADALSGIDGTCPADSIIGGEGSALSASAGVADRAGNTSTATVEGINLDRTAPSTSLSAPSAWVNDDVTVTLTAGDSLSGVADTYYAVNGGEVQQGTSVVLSGEGVYTLSYWSVDKAGNEEAHSTTNVRIDRSAPTITHTQSPQANAGGWNNTDVTVTFDCADQANLSGIASCTTPQTVTTDGDDHVVTGVAADNAGNQATAKATVKLDKTPPTISGSPDRATNAAGWYRGDVTVTFACDDALSGIVGCSDAATFGEGADQSATGTAHDAAGNAASATVGPINVDETAPTISGAPTTPPNGNGWYAGDVAIHWTCTDELSGVTGTCPGDSVITGEGGALSTSASVLDLAGNSASATVDGIKIDRTAPVTTADAPSGWQKTDVTVHFAATDNLSGVSATRYSIAGGPARDGSSVTLTAQGSQSLEFWSVDGAGNEEAHRSVVVQIDKSKPSITGAPTTSPNAAGWYKSPVTVHFECADQAGLSGIASCTPDQTVATSGANQSVTGLAADNAGNTASYTVSGLKVDLVAPTVFVGGVIDGWIYPLGAAPKPWCASLDLGSGGGTCSGTVSGGNANGVGNFTYTATGTDRAGNTSTRTVKYRVVYLFDGFDDPISSPGHEIFWRTSVFKAGSTVPVKFDLRRVDGTRVQPVTAPQWLAPVKISSLSALINEIINDDPATTGDTFQASGGGWRYNWSTKGLAAGYFYRIGVKLDDGTTRSAYIGLR